MIATNKKKLEYLIHNTHVRSTFKHRKNRYAALNIIRARSAAMYEKEYPM